MIHPNQFRLLVVRPVLQRLDMHSPAAEDLLMGTAAQESKMGRFLRQHPTGPARGVFQMEPSTHDDIWRNFLSHRSQTARIVRGYRTTDSGMPDYDEMQGNLYYAAAMCRLHYRRVRERLPDYGDVAGYARYWKLYYNTPAGKGTEHEFIRNWNRLVPVG